VGKDPSAKAERPGAAPAAGAAGKDPVRAPITYDVKIGDRTHKVTVSPG
jgi:hypothetical protein